MAFEVAEALQAPLDVIVVRKLGLPFRPEVAMGAIGEGGFQVVDQDLVARAPDHSGRVGVGRHSPRNRFVASALYQGGLGTLLLDLLTPVEERDRGCVFDIELLADRLVAATRWLKARPDTSLARVGYFGASTGTAAALTAAAALGPGVAAVVCRGGRPDLAWERLDTVTAPTFSSSAVGTLLCSTSTGSRKRDSPAATS